jgi:hypothetical protein
MLTVPTELGPGMTREASDTTTEVSAGGPTLSVAVPVTVPVTALNAAVMVELPWLWLTASPVDAPITPTVVFDELQVTKVVRSLEVPSLKVPVAVNR